MQLEKNLVKIIDDQIREGHLYQCDELYYQGFRGTLVALFGIFPMLFQSILKTF